jgi:lipopolysaccharide export LptBFGC system permease protein LptF
MLKFQYIIKLVFTNFIAILLGFFLAINLSTILGQSGDWGVLSAGLITAVLETISKILYNTKKKLIFWRNLF